MTMTTARRGAIVLMVALLLPLLIGFTAFVVDIGYARVVRAQLQTTADAAAESAAGELNHTAEGVVRARAVAVFVAAQNQANGDPVALAAADVEFGVWDPGSETFVPSVDPTLIDAVRVHAERDDLIPFFGRVVFSDDPIAPRVVSIAARGRDLGAGEVPYYLPFGLPLCTVEEHDPDELMDMTFELAPSAEDNTGWAMVGEGTNAASVSAHIQAMLPCMQQWAEEGHVDASCAPAGMEQEVDLNNGVAASALQDLSDAMADGVPWDEDVWGPLPAQNKNSTVPASVYGTVLMGPIPLFDGGSGYCDGGAWNETFPLAGFVWGAIYDVRSKGSSAERNVWIRLDLSRVYDIGDWYGGGSWGVTFTGPSVIVR